ncbi:D-arabinono-1,4-lactone oxidase [Pseudomonas sp. HK3]|jgi:FAD-linked oxidoreductase
MQSRRTFLQQLMGAAAVMAMPSHLLAANQKTLPWRNWSGSQVCYPAMRSAPADVSQLQQLLQQSTGIIRPVGSGHSFSPLVPTDDTIVSLSRLSGVISVDDTKKQATVWAGTRLGDMGEPLAKQGQALLNMPDIDEQSLAGAIATATHGTGAQLTCMSNDVAGLQMVLANGDIIECSTHKNRDIFNAARVNLGALGIVSQVTLQNQEPYKLKRETTWLPIEEILENADSLADNNRNFEFYFIPFTGMGFIDVQNTTDDPVTKSEKLDQNDGAEDLKTARDILSWSPKLRELILGSYIKTLSNEVNVANSWQNYASERNVRFNEMEYHLPRENMIKAFNEIRKVVETQFPEVFFPFEVRFIKQDDIWLSPFNGRETCSIAVHRYHKENYQAMFAAIEPIMQKYNGRPHWGKMNTMKVNQFSQHYTHWQDFNDIRRQLDPKGQFLNPYLASLFNT